MHDVCMLNNDNYFSAEAQKAYWGASMYKDFAKCEAAAMARINGEFDQEETVALLVGSYIDAHFSGEMREFLRDHPTIFTRNGTLRAEYRQADEIIERIERDVMMLGYLEGEKQRIMTGRICGIPFKIKMDAYIPDKRIVDLKIMRDMEPVYLPGEGKVPFWRAWGYDKSMAIYQEGEWQNRGGEKLPCYLAVATKQTPSDIAIIQLDQVILDNALLEVQADIETLDLVKRGEVEPVRCEKCAYCRSTKILTAPVSASMLMEQDAIVF